MDVNLTSATYLKIVSNHVHPFMAMVFPDGNGLFQQNNAPCHTAKVVQEWFEEQNIVFKVLPWPPNSPDLNPIEHLSADINYMAPLIVQAELLFQPLKTDSPISCQIYLSCSVYQ